MSDRKTTPEGTQEKFREEVKISLLRSGTTITALARKLRRPRNSVSMAINRGCFPKVRKQIVSALKLAA